MDIKDCESSFQMIGNRVCKLILKNDFVSISNLRDADYNIDADYEIKQIENKNNECTGILLLMVKTGVKDKEKHKLTVELQIEGCFTAIGMDKENFTDMLSVNGCTALYSIARAIIVSVSSQSMCGGQLIIPLINVFKLHEKKKAREALEK